MSLPAWVDKQLSHDLPELRAKGEGQEMEFKQEFPQQVSDLAKEIAAFATSNTGTILIGVKDTGDLIGLDGMEDAQARDALLRRLEGICSGSIKPAVTPQATWTMESGHIVLVVTVPKGSEPVYYAQGKPYLRHITTSRPAEPHEVVDLVKRFLGDRLKSGDDEQNEESAFYSELGAILHRALLWAETPVRERQVNPWLEEWRADYGYAASELRELAARDVAVRMGLGARIRQVADALNEVTAFRMTLGCGEKLEAVASRARELAFALKRHTIDKIPLSMEAVALARSRVREISRRLSDLSDRAQQVINAGRIEELKSEVGSMGQQLVQLSFYDLSALGENISERLREVAMRMRLIEAGRIYMDGGASMRRTVEEVTQCASQLDELAGKIDSSTKTV
jgi:ATP-dependent DNA helicase RecG